MERGMRFIKLVMFIIFTKMTYQLLGLKGKTWYLVQLHVFMLCEILVDLVRSNYTLILKNFFLNLLQWRVRFLHLKKYGILWYWRIAQLWRSRQNMLTGV
eukprot:403369024